MNKSKQRILGVGINWITIFLQVVISLFLIPFFLKSVGDKQYGLYSFSTSLISWADVLLVSIASTYFRFLTREKKENGEYGEARACGVFSNFFITIAIIVLLFGLLFDFLLFIEVIPLSEYTTYEKNQICLLILMSLISTFISSIFATSKSYPYYKEKYVVIYTLVLCQLLAQTTLSVIFLSLGLGVVFVALSHFGTAAIVTLVLSWFSKKNLKIKISYRAQSRSDKEYRKKLAKEIIIFSSFVIINTVVDMLNKSLDIMILGFYNADSVSTYQLAYTIPSYLINIVSIITVVYTQKINDAYYNGDGKNDMNKVFLKVSKIQTMVVFLLVGGFLTVGKEFITLWLGSGREDVYFVACILMLTYSITCSNALGVIARRICNCHKKASLIYLGIAIFNICFSILFVSVLPTESAIWGCVLGTIFTYFLGHYILMAVYDTKVTGLKINSFMKNFLFIMLNSVLIFAIVNRIFYFVPISNPIVLFISKGLLFVAFYFALLIFTEKNIAASIKVIICKIKNRIKFTKIK